MRNTVCLLLIFGAITCLYGQPQKTEEKRPIITLEQLWESDVIGELGVPLGKAVVIEAVVVRGNPRFKVEDGVYFLNVESVDGKKLPSPKKMRFHVHSAVSVELATGNFALYKLKTGRETGSLKSEQIADLEKGYVGQRKKLFAYETGGYLGMPLNLTPEERTWPDYDFRFINELMVLAERK